MNLDYLYYLRQALLTPLQQHGVEGASQTVQLLDDYQLVKEDVDSIMEISMWGGQADPYSKLDSKVSLTQIVQIVLTAPPCLSGTQMSAFPLVDLTR